MTATILVITGERVWTRRAIHLAGAMAREAAASVVIVRLQPVAHLEYLGAGEGETLLSFEEYDALAEYITTAESYGVKATVQTFEYSDYAGGVRGAVEFWTAAAVFAPAPAASFGWLARLRLWALRRALWRLAGCPFYTLGPDDGPLVQLPPAEAPAVPVAPAQVGVGHS
jgi:hypothetical protein